MRTVEWLVAVVLLALCLVGTSQASVEFGVLTDTATSKAEARAGFDLGQAKVWTVGVLFTYYAEEPDPPCSGGVYAKLAVDPNASIPVANWLPAIGTWMRLPETMKAETYLIGKGEVLPLEEGPDFSVSVGGGVEIGPVVGELLYRIVSGGESKVPALSSSMEVWLGLVIPLP